MPVLILGLLAFTVLWPLWFTVGGALMASDELTAALGPALLDTADGGYAVWTILPSWPTLQPLAELLLDTPQFFSAFWNTCLLAFAQIAGQLVVAAPASWAFAKLRFAGRRFLLLGYIALMVLPFQVLMVPNYLIATRLGIYDTPLSVILPGVFSAFPVFIMTRSFQDVPNELLEAAKLDGATAWQIFWKIGVPLGYAGIFAALVLNFIEGWNAVEQPLLFLKSQSNWPLSMYMNDIVTDNLGIAMAASLLSLIPAMLVFLYGQTYSALSATRDIQVTSLRKMPARNTYRNCRSSTKKHSKKPMTLSADAAQRQRKTGESPIPARTRRCWRVLSTAPTAERRCPALCTQTATNWRMVVSAKKSSPSIIAFSAANGTRVVEIVTGKRYTLLKEWMPLF